MWVSWVPPLGAEKVLGWWVNSIGQVLLNFVLIYLCFIKIVVLSSLFLSVFNNTLHFFQLQVLDRKMKGSPTCSCADCVKNKQSLAKMTSSVVNSKSNCGDKANHIDLSSLVHEEEHQNSLSPCQSCVNAQVCPTSCT